MAKTTSASDTANNEPVAVNLQCENCGNTEPEDFSRIYVEEHRQKLVDGLWQTTQSEEYDDGSHTYAFCDGCGSGIADEIAEEQVSRTQQVTEYIAEVLAGTIPPDDRLQLLAESPEDGEIITSTEKIEAFKITVVQEDLQGTKNKGNI